MVFWPIGLIKDQLSFDFKTETKTLIEGNLKTKLSLSLSYTFSLSLFQVIKFLVSFGKVMQVSWREDFSFNLEFLELWLIEGKPCFLFFRLWIIVLIWIEVIYGIMCFEMVLMILWGLVLIIEYLGDFYLLWDWFKLFESLNCGLKSCLKVWFDELDKLGENGKLLIIFDHDLDVVCVGWFMEWCLVYHMMLRWL